MTVLPIVLMLSDSEPEEKNFYRIIMFIMFFGLAIYSVLSVRIVTIDGEYFKVSMPFNPFVKIKKFRLKEIDLIHLAIWGGRRGTEISITTKGQTEVISFFMSTNNELKKMKSLLKEKNVKVEVFKFKV